MPQRCDSVDPSFLRLAEILHLEIAAATPASATTLHGLWTKKKTPAQLYSTVCTKGWPPPHFRSEPRSGMKITHTQAHCIDSGNLISNLSTSTALFLDITSCVPPPFTHLVAVSVTNSLSKGTGREQHLAVASVQPLPGPEPGDPRWASWPAKFGIFQALELLGLLSSLPVQEPKDPGHPACRGPCASQIIALKSKPPHDPSTSSTPTPTRTE